MSPDVSGIAVWCAVCVTDNRLLDYQMNPRYDALREHMVARSREMNVAEVIATATGTATLQSACCASGSDDGSITDITHMSLCHAFWPCWA